MPFSYKRTEKMSVPEIQLCKIFELVEQLEVKFKKLDYLADNILNKAMMAHGLIIIRKVSGEKENDLNQILDP